jgi:subtilase family serine protease
MKNLLFTLVFVLFAASAHSQATIQLTPDSVTVSAPMDLNPVIAYNQVKNLTNNTITIKWERTVISIDPDTLLTQVCDLNACYTPPVNTRTFQLGPQASGNMSVYLLNNSGQAAHAIVHMKYINLADVSNPKTGVYIFNADLVDAQEPVPAANVRLFPNPVIESFSLDQAEDVARLRVFALDGRKVATFDATTDNTYSLAGQPAGTYVVALESKSGKIFQAIEVKKQ